MKNVADVSDYFMKRIQEVEEIKAIKGKGLMLGISFDFPVAEIRKQLIFDEGIFTGGSADPNLLRLLPPLSVTTEEIDIFIEALKKVVYKVSNIKTNM